MAVIISSPVNDLNVTDDLVVADRLDAGGNAAIVGTLSVGGALTAAGGIILGAGDDIVMDGAGAGVKLGQTGSKIGAFGATPIVKPVALTPALTVLTHTAPGTPDYALQALVQNTGFGFVTADEGETVLNVIQNLATRVAELETKLTAFGLLAA